MAGEWIKMRHDLQDDPAVISMASDLETTEYAVIGMLHKWWSWLDRQSRNGHALSVTSAWLDRYIGVPNFTRALLSTGWLEGVDNDYSVPHFDRHNGKNAKNRALSADRKRRQRDICPADGHADVTQVAGQKRDQRRGEENYITPPTPPRGLPVDNSTGKKPRASKHGPPARNAPIEEWQKAGELIGAIARPGESPRDFMERVEQGYGRLERLRSMEHQTA